MRLLLLLPLYLLLSTATPVHQLDAGSDDITAALFSPSPTPSLTTTPLSSISITPIPDPTSSDLASPLPSVTPELETLPSTDASPTPSIPPSVSVSVTPSPGDELLPPMDDGFGDVDFGDDNDEDKGGMFGLPPDSVTEEAAPKSADGTVATGTSTVSVLALVGIALAILAPAVIIFWVVRRRSAGFQNIPRVDTDAYQGTSHGTSHGTFTVA